MLSKEEREELLKDGRSSMRRKEFAQGKGKDLRDSRSLDEFIQFLMDIQKVFSPFAISRKKTIARFNKL